MEFLETTLENGLEVVAECNGRAHAAALGFFVRAGSRDETANVAGVSHFLEHMAFKGTPTRSADDVNREFDAMGALHNAFTSEENTVYYAAVLPEFQDRALELLADILRPALRQDDFETERQVVLEEIRMYEDQPPFGADEKCRALFFGPHPLGQSVLGTLESVGGLTAEAMREYHRRRYGPGNVTLAAAGRVDFDRLVEGARRCCGAWAPARAGRDTADPVTREGFQAVHKPSATQQYVVQLALGPGAQDRERHAARLLASVLGDDSGSRLFWELVDPGRADAAVCQHCEFQGAGVLATYLSCDPALAPENLRSVRALYARAANDLPVTPEELAQAKSKTCSRIVLASERSQGRLFAVGGEWVERRRYVSVREDLDEVAGVTCDDVAAVLARFPLTRCATVTVGRGDAALFRDAE